MKIRYVVRMVSAAALLALTGCGSSSSDSDTADSYIQFYNGAAGAANSTLVAGDNSIGNATYGDASALVAVEPDSYEMKLTDVASGSEMVNETLAVASGTKTLVMLTQTDEQYDYLTLSFKRDDELDKQFNLYLVNLSVEQPALDVYLSPEDKTFADAELLESLSLNEVTTTAKTKSTGKYNIYLTLAGQTTPIFITKAANFSYTSGYALIIRDQHGPIANQLALDVVLNSTSVTSFSHEAAIAQYRLYNSLTQPVTVSLNGQAASAVNAGELSDYFNATKGDYSVTVRDNDNQIILNSALLSIAAGDSKALVLYRNANAQAELLTTTEPVTPQLQSHDILVSNLINDSAKIQIYFVRQNETIADAKYHVKNLAFAKQQMITLPKDYYAIALVRLSDNGNATLLDKIDSQMLQSGKNYMLQAEQDDNAPSGYKLTLVN